jgi:hypothetical protein
MTVLVQVMADQLGSPIIQDGSSVNTTFTPCDGVTYQLVTWVVRRSEDLARFFAIARAGAPLTGAFVPLAHELAFVDYVELFGVSQDVDLELLWAGWRALLYLTGRDDQMPPVDLPVWRPDWYRELSAIPQASYLIVTAQDQYVVSLHRIGPQPFTAAVTDSAGRQRGETGGYPSRRDALHAAQFGVLGNMEALEDSGS